MAYNSAKYAIEAYRILQFAYGIHFLQNMQSKHWRPKVKMITLLQSSKSRLCQFIAGAQVWNDSPKAH